jgi:Immunoglobulin I-set domain
LRELKINSFLFCFTEKPEILQDPNDLEVVFGETAVFKCKAGGDPIPEIKWMLNSKEVTNDSRVRVGLDGTLEIDRIDTRDQGVYKVKWEINI